MALTIITRGFGIGTIQLIILRGFTAFRWAREAAATSTWTEEAGL